MSVAFGLSERFIFTYRVKTTTKWTFMVFTFDISNVEHLWLKLLVAMVGVSTQAQVKGRIGSKPSLKLDVCSEEICFIVLFKLVQTIVMMSVLCYRELFVMFWPFSYCFQHLGFAIPVSSILSYII